MSTAELIAAYVDDNPDGVTAAQVNEALGITGAGTYLSRLARKHRVGKVGVGRYAPIRAGVQAGVQTIQNAVHPQVRASIKPRHHADEFPALGPATARSLSDTLQKVARKLETYLDGEEPYRVDTKGAYSPNPAYTILLGYLAEVRQLMVAVHKMGIAERETAVLEFDALSGFPEFVAWLLEALKPHPEALRDVLVAMSDKGWAGGTGDSGGA